MSFDYIFWILFLCLLTWNFIFILPNAAVQYLKREKAWLKDKEKDKEQRRKEAIKHLTGKD
jgi:hypothetical protein